MTQVMENEVSSFAGENWKFAFSEIENQLEPKMMPIIPKDIGHKILQQKLSLNFLDQEKRKQKETSNTTDLEHLHLDGFYE